MISVLSTGIRAFDLGAVDVVKMIPRFDGKGGTFGS